MLGEFRWLDFTVLIVYFTSQLAMGPYFARRAKSTESYFVGNRSYPGWLLGISMFGGRAWARVSRTPAPRGA